jgi:hypothetical protein
MSDSVSLGEHGRNPTFVPIQYVLSRQQTHQCYRGDGLSQKISCLPVGLQACLAVLGLSKDLKQRRGSDTNHEWYSDAPASLVDRDSPELLLLLEMILGTPLTHLSTRGKPGYLGRYI